jgi:hypothetical protein
LKDGSEYFTSKEVHQIVRVARLGVKGSLNAIYMLEEDVQYFTNASSDIDTGELQEQCSDTVLEYEESMRVWKEMKDTGNLCTSDTDWEEEDELIGEDLLQTPPRCRRRPAQTQPLMQSRVLGQRLRGTPAELIGTRAATRSALRCCIWR